MTSEPNSPTYPMQNNSQEEEKISSENKPVKEDFNAYSELDQNSAVAGLDIDSESRWEIGQKLRDIERETIVSMEAARSMGLGLMIGSGVYINEQFRDIGDAIEESVPEGITVENYMPEQVEEMAAEIEPRLDEGVGELKELVNLPEVPDYSMQNSLSDLEHVDLSKYESEMEELLKEADPVIDEIVEKFNTNVNSWQEMGIDPSEGIIQQINAETATDAFLYSFDNFAHLAITGTMSNFVAQAADRYTDRELLITAAGMSTALVYAVAKEGFYEGGAGLQFNLENLDVQGDLISNTMGAAIGTWSYLQNREKEKVLEDDKDTGLTGSAARKMGRAYQKGKYIFRTDP